MRRYVVPTAKRIGADLLGLAETRKGNVLTGRENLRMLQLRML